MQPTLTISRFYSNRMQHVSSLTNSFLSAFDVARRQWLAAVFKVQLRLS